MLLNNFSVRVPEGREHHQYVELQHDTKYSLVLANKNTEDCDARVEIDGQAVGTWRIKAKSTVRLERPVDSEGRFTFYKQGTEEASKAQLEAVGEDKLGLVCVWFTPAKRQQVPQWISTPQWGSHYPSPTPPPIPLDYQVDCNTIQTAFFCASSADMPSMSQKSVGSITREARLMSSGGTGLSGKSTQQFVEAQELDLDMDRQTFIALRLVCVEKEESDIRPLVQRATPVPPPLK